MKIRISNKWNKETNSFDKALYDIKETDGTLYGRFTLSAKKKLETGEKWTSAHMSFTAFKSKIDHMTLATLRGHDGKLIEVEGNLSVDMANDGKGYFKFIINSAKPCEEKKVVTHFQEKAEENEEEIPF